MKVLKMNVLDKLKAKYLAEMFSGFPSFRASEEEIATMMLTYLRSLSGYGPEVVSEAAVSATKKGGAWPPSAPQFYELCNQTAARRFQRDTLAQLPPPIEQYTDEHREAMKARFTQLVDDLKHGRLVPPRNGFTDEQLADPNCIVNRKGKTPYTTRPGPPFGFKEVNAPYGFLTPQELALPSVRMPAKRIEPTSWREKWERQKGWNQQSDYMGRRYGEAAE